VKIRTSCANEGLSMYVPMQVNDCVNVDAILDTGASLTIFSATLLDAMPADKRPQIKPLSSPVHLETADDHRLDVIGTCELTMKFDKLTVVWEVYVAPIGVMGLLGLDFLHAMDYEVGAKSGLYLKGHEVETIIVGTPLRIAQVSLAESLIVPANSEKLVVGYVHGGCDFTCCIVEPKEGQFPDLLIGRSLVNPSRQDIGIPVRVLNTSSEDLPLPVGVSIGTLYEVDSISDASTGDSSQGLSLSVPVCTVNAKSTTCTVPSHVLELYNRSITADVSERGKRGLAQLLEQYQHGFAKCPTDIGHTSVVTHSIPTGDAKPIKQAVRRTPRAFAGEEENVIKDQIDAGVLQESNSPWASPLVYVRKKDGTVRACVDYRALNNVTMKDTYPLPRIADCLDCIQEAKWFGTLDLQSGYWQIQVDECDRHKTAVVTRNGLYEYKAMPFGLAGAPATFERCMELILRGLQWKTLILYLDDIIVFGDSEEAFLSRLEEVLKRLTTAGLKLKPSKCELFKHEVSFLGYVVTATGIATQPEKVAAIKEWPSCKDVSEVRAFLGLSGYYRRFIRGYAHIASPLFKLLQAEQTFEWTSDCQDAFEGLKAALTGKEVMAYPKDQGLYILDTDASNSAIGAVISQMQWSESEQAEVERPIAYASKSLSKAQRRYCVTRRELLALVTFTQEYRHYLLGRKFVIRTDHNSLRWLLSFRDPTDQTARWIEILSRFDFQILHRPGNKHGNADGMSRIPCDPDMCDCYDEGSMLADLPCGGCAQCTKRHNQWVEVLTEEDVSPLTTRVKSVHMPQPATSRGYVHQVKKGRKRQEPPDKPPKEALDLSNLDLDRIKAAQASDPSLKMVIDWVESGEKPTRDKVASNGQDVRHLWLLWDQLQIKGGVLYKTWITPDAVTSHLLIVIPKSLQMHVLYATHNHLMSGHLGIKKTLSKAKQYFYWLNMKTSVQEWIRHCSLCGARKKPSHSARAGLTEYTVGAPMDRVATDILGPFPTSATGNKYILLCMDYFTKFVEAYPIPEQTAEVTAHKIVYEFFSRYGIPLELHSDQGRNYESKLFKEVMSLLGSHKTRTSPYHAASNGMVERMNKTLLDMIAIFVSDNQSDWDQQLPLLTAAYRSCVHDTTKYTPNMLMFGREAYLPFHFGSGRSTVSSTKEGGYVTTLQDRLEAISSLVRDHLQLAAVRQRKEYDTRKHENHYDVGSLVYRLDKLRVVGRSPKLKSSPWKGPNVVIRKISDLLYELKPSAVGKCKVVHHDLLKPYVTDEVPPWASQLVNKLRADSVTTTPKEKEIPAMIPANLPALPTLKVPATSHVGPRTNKSAKPGPPAPPRRFPPLDLPAKSQAGPRITKSAEKPAPPLRRSKRMVKAPNRLNW
jgi:hypothetical protein